MCLDKVHFVGLSVIIYLCTNLLYLMEDKNYGSLKVLKNRDDMILW